MNKKLNHFPDGSLPIRLIRIDRQDTIDLHDHAFHELVIILNGEGEHTTGNERYKISAGDVFLLKPGTAHSYQNTTGLELVNILYLPGILNMPLYDLADSPGYHAFFELEPAMRAQHGFRSRLQVSNKQLNLLKTLVEKIEHESSNNTPGRLFRMAANLMQLIGLVSEYYSVTDAPDRAGVLRLGKVISYIETHYAKPLTLEALAKRAAMSPSTLHRAFTSSMGEAPINYLILVRLDRAKQLLQDTNLSISEISSTVGFNDSNYFSRIFKKHIGESPGEFRKQSG